MYEKDKRIVMTLDAGGTNFVFSAVQAHREIVEALRLPSSADKLEQSLDHLEQGFSQVLSQLKKAPVAISFAFPGPADYSRGIIMDLNNFPAYRGGIALGAFLKNQFKLPVFINNDADLFTYGECMAGALPYVNQSLEKAGSTKRYHNLIGFTLGTGFGCGITRNNELYLGDNGSAGEVLLLRHKTKRDIIIEDGVSIRAIKRVYWELSGDMRRLEPLDIYNIADGKMEGDMHAAKKTFKVFGVMAAEGIAAVSTVLDGLVVLGGGLTGARKYFMPSLMQELNGSINTLDGQSKSRLEMKVYNLDQSAELEDFLHPEIKKIKVPRSKELVDYEPQKRMGIIVSKLGTSKAIALGAYAYALNELDKKPASSFHA
ncbi:MAG: ROK family protein [Bacteroidales bacterium]|nr:ROK family protein [Bacteroidales bacterium]